MSDWSDQEFQSLRGLKIPLNISALTGSAGKSSTRDKSSLGGRLLRASSSRDWRQDSRRPVPSVKNQGKCGSCWAFSATNVIESAHRIKYPSSPLLQLSEQELVNCLYSYDGCEGGWMTNAFSYVMANPPGLLNDTQLPYTSGSTGLRTNVCFPTQTA